MACVATRKRPTERLCEVLRPPLAAKKRGLLDREQEHRNEIIRAPGGCVFGIVVWLLIPRTVHPSAVITSNLSEFEITATAHTQISDRSEVH